MPSLIGSIARSHDSVGWYWGVMCITGTWATRGFLGGSAREPVQLDAPQLDAREGRRNHGRPGIVAGRPSNAAGAQLALTAAGNAVSIGPRRVNGRVLWHVLTTPNGVVRAPSATKRAVAAPSTCPNSLVSRMPFPSRCRFRSLSRTKTVAEQGMSHQSCWSRTHYKVTRAFLGT